MVPPLSLVAQPAMYQNRSAASGTSAARATLSGFPLSRQSSSASSSPCSEIRSPMRCIIRPLSEGVIRLQGPSSKARRAARTARSVLGVALGDTCQHLTRGGVEGVERLAAGGQLELAIDEQRTCRRTEMPSALGDRGGNSHSPLVLLEISRMACLQHIESAKVTNPQRRLP